MPHADKDSWAGNSWNMDSSCRSADMDSKAVHSPNKLNNSRSVGIGCKGCSSLAGWHKDRGSVIATKKQVKKRVKKRKRKK